MRAARGRFWFVGAAIAVAAAPGAAQSNGGPGPAGPSIGADSRSDDIIVTAQKREQRLLDVPQSVSVVTGATLAQVHAERFQDYITRVPSAAFVETQAGNTRLVLRGINTGGVGATVATYVDETPYGSATALANGNILTPDLDPSDIERVEVLRGPQGTLYGANSLGGLVKFVTVAPTTEAVHAFAEGSVESVDHGSTGGSLRAALNLPLGPTVAVRASGFYRKDPGFIDDPRLGHHVNDGKTYGGRISALFKPVDELEIRASAVLENLNSNGTNQVDVDPVTLMPTIGRYSQRRLIRQPNDIRYRIYNLTASYDFGPVTLLSSTSYGMLNEAQLQDNSGVFGPALTGIFGVPLGAAQIQDVGQRRFTEEVRLTSSHSRVFEWSIGGFYTREHNAINQVVNGIDGVSGAAVPAYANLALASLDSKYREIAGFANGTIHFSRQIDLTVGGRYSHNSQRAVQSSSGPLAGDSQLSSGSSDNVFTYSVAPSFKPNDDTTIYARIARGYRPGGPNVLPPTAPDSVPRTFGADTTTNYEVGIKSQLLDRKLSLELTGFYIDWNNIQLFTSVNGFGANTNGGSARSKGIEFSATATPIKGLSLTANGAYIDATLTSDASPLTGGLRGDRLPYSARFASTLGVDYERPLSGKVTGTAGVSWRYTGPRRSDFNTDFGQRRLAAFSQIDAHAGVTFDRFRLDAFVRNIGDSRGIVDLGASGSALDGAVGAAIVRPRSFGATLGFRY